MMRIRGHALVAVVLVAVGCHATVTPPLRPRTTEDNITQMTTSLLERSQFSHRRFDDALAATLLDRYLDALDATRSLFLQSDIDEFAAYRPSLAQSTRVAGDTHAAQSIFRRYLDRSRERAVFVTNMLRTSTFDFTDHEVYSLDREHASYPKTLDAAHDLWRQQARAAYLAEKLGGKAPAQIVQTLSDRYAHQVQAMTLLKASDVLDIYLDTLAHVYDPHSDYLGREQLESLSIAMNLSLVGIGATLESVDGYCTIRELVPGGPAARSGALNAGDRIVSVKQESSEPVDVVGMPLSHTVELIRGHKGSPVTLSILPKDGEAKHITLVRDDIKLEDQEAKATITDVPTSDGKTVRVGIIDLPSFYADMDAHGGTHRSATADVARLLAKLKAEQVLGLVLDLRQNPGGSLQEAVALTGLFIRKGPVVQTRDQRGEIEVGADTDASVAYDGPLVVLTSRMSASASEILAGALQDYGRALIVGDPSTFGKGTVQTILPLARVMDSAGLAHAYDPGALKITTSKFYRPSGASTQLRGVASDIVLPSTTDVDDISETTLKDALPWDTIPAARYEHLDRVAPYIDRLRQRSSARVEADKQFGYVREDRARLKQSLAAKSVSLNESERQKEMAEAKAREESRAREAKASGSEFAQRAITLEALDAPDPHASTSSTKRSEDDAASLRESVRIAADYAVLSSAPR